MASATIGPTEFCNGNGGILILISLSQSQKRQHSKGHHNIKKPKRHGVRRSESGRFGALVNLYQATNHCGVMESRSARFGAMVSIIANHGRFPCIWQLLRSLEHTCIFKFLLKSVRPLGISYGIKA